MKHISTSRYRYVWHIRATKTLTNLLNGAGPENGWLITKYRKKIYHFFGKLQITEMQLCINNARIVLLFLKKLLVYRYICFKKELFSVEIWVISRKQLNYQNALK